MRTTYYKANRQHPILVTTEVRHAVSVAVDTRVIYFSTQQEALDAIEIVNNLKPHNNDQTALALFKVVEEGADGNK